jgi:hypothetical protein
MKKLYIVLAILSTSVFLTSCLTGNDSKSKNATVMVDISKSIKPEVLDWYIQTIETDICANLTQFDKIKVILIDGASETASKVLLDLDLFDHKSEWDVMGLNANETDKLKKAAFTKFIHSKMLDLKAAITDAKIHRQDVGNATDILGAIEVATNNYDGGFDNSIVIMSDMEQYADKCKMCSKGKATEWLSLTGGIKFKNINKFSVTIITGEQISMDKAYYNEIKSYWTELFKKQGVKNFSYLGADASHVRQSFLANN